MTSQELLDQIQQESQTIIREVEEEFLPRDEAILRQRPSEAQWNTLDCLEHLSLTYDYYVPQIESCLQKAPVQPENETYKSGWLGRMSIRAMEPKDNRISYKMKTFERIKPLTDHRAAEEIIHRFIQHQQSLERLAQQARAVSLNKGRVTTLAGPLVRLRLGDCFRFLLAHDRRHLLQARRAMLSTKSS